MAHISEARNLIKPTYMAIKQVIVPRNAFIPRHAIGSSACADKPAAKSRAFTATSGIACCASIISIKLVAGIGVVFSRRAGVFFDMPSCVICIAARRRGGHRRRGIGSSAILAINGIENVSRNRTGVYEHRRSCVCMAPGAKCRMRAKAILPPASPGTPFARLAGCLSSSSRITDFLPSKSRAAFCIFDAHRLAGNISMLLLSAEP